MKSFTLEHGFMVRRNTEYGLDEDPGDEEGPEDEETIQGAIDVLEENLEQLRKGSE